MEKIKNTLKALSEINSGYQLSNETASKMLSEMQDAKVCTPIIGKFSSGKSALLNALLGYSIPLLREDITPETAVPAEISYSPAEDSFQIVYNNGTTEEVAAEDYRRLDVDATTTRCTQLRLNNDFLERIPDVMLVDMPGFESGFAVHDRAIDDYLPRSLAYILAFPADDMILRSSISSILKELKLHKMPICVVITKYDKRNDEFDATLAVLKQNLQRCIGNQEIRFCFTSSVEGDVGQVEEFLLEIQENSHKILAEKFRTPALAELARTENYLRTTLKGSELSESELEEQEAKLEQQLTELNGRFSNEKADFERQLSDCVEEIKSDVQMALEAEEDSFVAMVINNQSINEKLNTVVRSAVTKSIQRCFIPKVERYLRRVENCLNGESIGDIHIAFHFNSEDVSKGIVTTVVSAVAAILVAGPIIGGVIAAILALANKLRNDKKREEMKNIAIHKNTATDKSIFLFC